MSSEADEDNNIASFMAFSGSSDPAVARQYLEMSGGDLQTAVSLFMDTNGELGGGGTAAAGNASAGGAGLGSPEIRAPDASRSMRLIGGPASPGDGMPPAALLAAVAGPAHAALMAGMMGHDDDATNAMASTWASRDLRETVNREAERRRNRAGGVNNARRRRQGSDADNDEVQVVDRDGQAMDEDYNYEDESDDDTGGAAAGAGQPPSLSAMFSQPSHLMHRGGGFMGAKNFAKDARRWLLVNIQNDDDFACHALNRDVWRDELVENLVREGFVLWQAVSIF
jgi:hypothetical protein